MLINKQVCLKSDAKEDNVTLRNKKAAQVIIPSQNLEKDRFISIIDCV
jgi:hypothetical protein